MNRVAESVYVKIMSGVLVVGLLALFTVVFGQAALEKWTNYTTVEKVLQNSYFYKIEYRPSFWKNGLDSVRIYYTNDLSLQIVIPYYDHHRYLRVIAKDEATVSLDSRKARKAIDVFTNYGSSSAHEVPLAFDKADGYFLRVTSTYNGSVIVDTITNTSNRWADLLIDPLYLIQ